MKKYRVGIISGFFNPIHAGHIDYINKAKELCEYLIVIVNNDEQQIAKIGKVLLPIEDRLYIINNIKAVDSSTFSVDKDSSVSESIKMVYSMVSLVRLVVGDEAGEMSMAFINSGDRSPENENTKESEVCRSLGIDIVYIDMPKRDSSTRLRSS